MLMLDEIDKMLQGTARQQRIFLNSLRYITNQLKIPIVCAGASDAELAIRTDRDLADRFSSFKLGAWREGPKLKRLLASFAATLPLRLPSNLTASAMQEVVIKTTQGRTGRIFTLFEALATTAIESGQEQIDLSTFENEKFILPLVSMQKKEKQDFDEGYSPFQFER